MNIKSLGVADIIASPHPVDDCLAGQYPSGIGQQDVLEFEFFQWQLLRFTANDHLMLIGVKSHVTHLER